MAAAVERSLARSATERELQLRQQRAGGNYITLSVRSAGVQAGQGGDTATSTESPARPGARLRCLQVERRRCCRDRRRLLACFAFRKQRRHPGQPGRADYSAKLRSPPRSVALRLFLTEPSS